MLAPFAGAFITQHYGRPSLNQHVIQVEIDRAIYMDEDMIRPNRDFEVFRKLMEEIILELVEIGRKLPLAAE